MISMKLAGDAYRRMKRAAQVAEATIKGAVRKASSRVVRQAKINARQTLNTTGQSKGFLSRSITTSDVPGRGVRDFAQAVGPTAIYGRIHEFGGVIKPVKAERLMWRAPDGSFRTAMSVTIPARPYLKPALETVQPQIEDDMRKALTYMFNDTGGGGGVE